MFKSDFDNFAALLDSAAEMMGKPTPQAGQVAMFFRVMQRYPIETITEAMEAHLRDPQRGRFFPVPADLIAKIEESNHELPASDEAWAISLKAHDEAETVVWTSQMAEAWGVCKPVFDMGDEVGARMAFKGAYDRLTAKAKAEGKPLKWSVSLGFDIERRALALQNAQAQGRIEEVPAHMRLEAQTSAPQLEYHAERKMPPDVRKLLHDLLNKKNSENWHERGEEERQRLAERKKQIQAQVDGLKSSGERPNA
jgi:hypothetical protein